MTELLSWFPDLSKWNNLTEAQLLQLIEHDICGALVKGAQGNYREDQMVDEHTALLTKFNVPYGIYHWADPIGNKPKENAAFAMATARKYGARAIALDLEQYWLSWDEWYKVIVLRQPGQVRPFSQEYLLKFYRDYILEVKKLNTEKLPIIAYSARWFLHGYCRQLAAVIRDECDFYWNAAYVSWIQQDQDPHVTWDEFTNTYQHLKPDTSKYLPNGIRKWDLWQFAVMPMKGWSGLDCNVITPSAQAAIFGGEPITPPPPPPPIEPGTMFVQVTAETLNIRSSPKVLAGNDIGDLHKGDIKPVLNIAGSGAWIEFEPGKFCCIQEGKKRYAEVVKKEE